MELEKVEVLNTRLKEVYGIDTITGLAMWRIVWSNDQYEWRLSEYTPEGIKLIQPKVQWLPKYKQWIPDCYVLEQLVLVPSVSQQELPEARMSYEPMYPFKDPQLNSIAPTWVGCQFVISHVEMLKGKGKPTVYKDPEAGLKPQEILEQKNERLKEIENALYGDESDLKGKTHLTKEAIIVPNKFERTH